MLERIASAFWGPFTLLILLGLGGYLTLQTRFFSIRCLPEALRQMCRGKTQKGVGETFGLDGHEHRAGGDDGDGEYCRSRDGNGGRRTGSCPLDADCGVGWNDDQVFRSCIGG